MAKLKVIFVSDPNQAFKKHPDFRANPARASFGLWSVDPAVNVGLRARSLAGSSFTLLTIDQNPEVYT